MGFFGRTESTVQEKANVKKPLFDEKAQAKARLTRAENKAQKEKDAAELQALRLKAEDFEVETRKLKRENKEAVEKKDAEVTALKAKVDALNEAAEASLDIHKRTIVLEQKEALMEAKEAASDTLKAEFKKLKEETEEEKKTEYTKGYADGLSDGIRKGIDAAAEDRKMMGQVAMMSAASHTPAAAETIAKNMNNALPATASS